MTVEIVWEWMGGDVRIDGVKWGGKVSRGGKGRLVVVGVWGVYGRGWVVVKHGVHSDVGEFVGGSGLEG